MRALIQSRWRIAAPEGVARVTSLTWLRRGMVFRLRIGSISKQLSMMSSSPIIGINLRSTDLVVDLKNRRLPFESAMKARACRDLLPSVHNAIASPIIALRSLRSEVEVTKRNGSAALF